jgi:cell shape-determining protein MreC
MDSAIQMVQEKLDLISRDPEMFRAYEKYEKAERDYISGINAAQRQEREKWQSVVAEKDAENKKTLAENEKLRKQLAELQKNKNDNTNK